MGHGKGDQACAAQAGQARSQGAAVPISRVKPWLMERSMRALRVLATGATGVICADLAFWDFLSGKTNWDEYPKERGLPLANAVQRLLESLSFTDDCL